MTIHVVDVEHITHLCPSHPEPHPYDTRRNLVHVIPGGPCRNPVTIHCGNVTTTIDCHRRRPANQQCPACRIIVTERSITTRSPSEADA